MKKQKNTSGKNELGDGEKVINAMTSCTDNLSELVTVVICSLSDSHPDYSIRFYLFHTDICKEKLDLIFEFCADLPNVTFYDVKIEEDIALYVQLVEKGVFHSADIARYLWFEAYKYLPQDMERVLYLDALDTLVVKNIDEFYNGDFNDTFLLCVDELNQFSHLPRLENIPPAREYYGKTGDKETVERITYGLFNSGSIVLNLPKFRKEAPALKTYVDVWHWTKSLGLTPFGDQGLFSLVFGTNYALKSFDFNYRNFVSDTLRDTCAVIHYTGFVFKPYVYYFSEEQEDSIIRYINIHEESIRINNAWRIEAWYLYYNRLWWDCCQKTPAYDFHIEIAKDNADALIAKSAEALKSDDIPNDVYFVLNKAGNAWDILGSDNKNGATLTSYPRHYQPNQQFSFKRNNDDTYTITAIHSGKTLEVRNGSLANGAAVSQWDDAEGFACKRWYVLSVGDGYYRFVNKNSGKVMDVEGMKLIEDNAKIQQWSWLDNDAQKFKLVKVEEQLTELESAVGTIGELGDRCAGCGLCADICPQRCISMHSDSEGFLRPSIDKDRCVHCGLCDKKCPELKAGIFESEYAGKQEKYAFMAHDEVRMVSASGGVFNVLAQMFLDDGNVVCGAGYSEDFRSVRHFVVDNRDGLANLLSSKYVQSDMSGVYNALEVTLTQGKKALYCGCPCQCAAMRSRFGERDNLYTLDLICHGVPSPKVWAQYLDECVKHFRKTEDAKLIHVNQRSKTTVWDGEHLMMMSDGNTIFRDYKSSYFAAFMNNWSLRPSCHSCRYGNMKRQGDLTIGDFWGISQHRPKLNDRKGTSIVYANTRKGADLLAAVRVMDRVKVLEKTDFPYSQPSLAAPAHLQPYKREVFFKSLAQCSVMESTARASRAPEYQVALVGRPHNGNYGAILTNLAAYETIKNLGYTAAYIPHMPIQNSYVMNFFVKHGVAFYKYRKFEDLRELNKHADVFITVSDQTFYHHAWGDWGSYDNRNYFYFQAFVDSGKKKLSFGSSFSEADFKLTDKIKGYLSDFDRLSVREDSSVDVLARYGISAAHICDPVFTPTMNFYKKLEKSSTLKREDVEGACVAYFANENAHDINKYISAEIQRQINRNIIPIGTIKIADFLRLFMNAGLIYTDSFHGVCLALIFNRDFVYVERREGWSSRIQSLSRMFGLSDRIIFDVNSLKIDELPPIDWGAINKSIDEVRAFAQKWLKDAIDN